MTKRIYTPEDLERAAIGDLVVAQWRHRNGFPMSDLHKRAVDDVELVAKPASQDFISSVLEQSVLPGLGVRVFRVPTALAKVPAVVSDTLAGWFGSGDTADRVNIPESDPQFEDAGETSVFYQLGAFFDMSNELLADSPELAVQVATESATIAARGRLENGFFIGNGVDENPSGLRGQTGLQTSTGAATMAALVNLWGDIASYGAIVTGMAFSPNAMQSVFSEFPAGSGQPIELPVPLRNAALEESVYLRDYDDPTPDESNFFLGDFRQTAVVLTEDVSIMMASRSPGAYQANATRFRVVLRGTFAFGRVQALGSHSLT